MKKYCCTTFRDLMSNKGEKGFSIEKKGDIYEVVFKAVADIELDNLLSLLRASKAIKELENYRLKNISLEGSMGIRYCPWCGTSLYTSDKSLLARIFKK